MNLAACRDSCGSSNPYAQKNSEQFRHYKSIALAHIHRTLLTLLTHWGIGMFDGGTMEPPGPVRHTDLKWWNSQVEHSVLKLSPSIVSVLPLTSSHQPPFTQMHSKRAQVKGHAKRHGVPEGERTAESLTKSFCLWTAWKRKRVFNPVWHNLWKDHRRSMEYTCLNDSGIQLPSLKKIKIGRIINSLSVVQQI